MKRDLNLVRSIILAVEEFPTGFVLSNLTIDGYTDEQIGYHSYLIVDAGLANGVDARAIDSTSPTWKILHLTSAGHDFADLAREDGNWKKTVGLVTTKAGGATLDIVKDVLVSLAKGTLGLS